MADTIETVQFLRKNLFRDGIFYLLKDGLVFLIYRKRGSLIAVVVK
jgi:hypothetical protein